MAFCPTHDVLGDFYKASTGSTVNMNERQELILPSSTSTVLHQSVVEWQFMMALERRSRCAEWII